MALYVNLRSGRYACLRSVATIVLLTLSFTFSASEKAAAQWRSVDGSGNNLVHSDWGAVATPLQRQATPVYPGDGSGTTILEPPARANPRDISNAIIAQGVVNLRIGQDAAFFAALL